MAISNHNEVSELLTMALGHCWIEVGLTDDAEILEAAASTARSQAETYLWAREVFDAMALGHDVDPGTKEFATNIAVKLLGDMASVTLSLEGSARTSLSDPDFQVDMRAGAARATKSTCAQETRADAQ